MDILESISILPPYIGLGTLVWMIIWWVTECVPLGFTSILAPFIFVGTGILSVNQALQKFSDPIIWIFISGFILAAAFKKSGLDERIAYTLALLYKGKNPKIAVFFIACLSVFILSITGSITASSTIVFPFVVAFLNILGITSNSTKKDNENIVNQHNKNNVTKHNNKKTGKWKTKIQKVILLRQVSFP
jgi:solute carrier family 13 (sodium-dependent dicarboxylate transporter), member 2/3/5